MKKLLFLIIFIIILMAVVNFGINYLNIESNQKYIQDIFNSNVELRNKYGYIKKYKIKKIGRYLGGGEEESYDYYVLYVEGEKKQGIIYLNIYHNNDGVVTHYNVK